LTGMGVGVGAGEGDGAGAGAGTGAGAGAGAGGGVTGWGVAHPAIIITAILNRTIPANNLFIIMLTSFLASFRII
jgi:hypothetical protein